MDLLNAVLIDDISSFYHPGSIPLVGGVVVMVVEGVNFTIVIVV